MCSRFENKTTGEFLFKKISKDRKVTDNSVKNLKQSGISPQDDIIIIKIKPGELEITTNIWGIRFSGENTPLIFNSRIETISSKKYWSDIFDKNRCIIPATAFYEWKQEEKIKIPHRISLRDSEIFYIAGIFIKLNGNYHASMITTSPNNIISRIHNRMPVIMDYHSAISFLESDYKTAISQCNPLDDSIGINIEVAEEILTEKQREYLKKIR
ncbi:MAG: SOS response-associated peptidase [Ignavibacteria bacterium]|nr:SOS response-associated peptidase [Ignavibacteria bacterium]